MIYYDDDDDDEVHAFPGYSIVAHFVVHNWDAGSGAIHVLDVVSRDGVSFLIAEENFVVIGRTWSDSKGLGQVLRNVMEERKVSAL